MIKFFRKIRQNLLSEYKIGKYLLYAVGEIILVVIGILIAIQINNSNEGRKAEAAEKLLLLNLKSDFTNRLLELERLQGYRQIGLEAAKNLTTIIDSGKITIPENEMDSLLVTLDHAYIFNDELMALDVLFSTGKINSLKNEELKSLLVNWPVVIEETIERTSMLIKNTEDQFIVLNKYISYRDLYHEMHIGLDVPIEGKSKMSKDYQSLIEDRTFENLLTKRYTLLYFSSIENEVAMDNAKSILNLLVEEIEK